MTLYNYNEVTHDGIPNYKFHVAIILFNIKLFHIKIFHFLAKNENILRTKITGSIIVHKIRVRYVHCSYCVHTYLEDQKKEGLQYKNENEFVVCSVLLATE